MYEQASERWSPVQSVEKVILSVISMLAGEFVLPSYLPTGTPITLSKNPTSKVVRILTAANYTVTIERNTRE